METIIIWQYLIAIISISAICYTIHNSINKITLKKHKKKQLRRYFTASLIGMAPVAIAQIPLSSPVIIFNAVTSLIWAFTAPAVMSLSRKKNHTTSNSLCMDIACGIALFGFISALQIAVSYTGGIINLAGSLLIGAFTFGLTLICLIQWGYYIIYGAQIEHSEMTVTLNTNYNEVIELFKSFPIERAILIPISIILLLAADINLACLTPAGRPLTLVESIFILLYIAGISVYLFRKERGIFKRSYIVELYLEIKDYNRRTLLYGSQMKERLQNLQVKAAGQPDKPHTYIMVIGESASRDYMSAYVDMEYDTTPWLRSCKEDTLHNIIFTNAYSCHQQTVPTLERTLTERNQYNQKEFYESTSIIDIVRAAGYNTYWYSNQGYLGASETSITLVANTSDTAKWTKQSLNKGEYDGELLNFLKEEVDATKNNFVVLHLKGSHANYIMRYPAEATQWGEPGVENLMLNYYNSLHYTDSLLKEVYEYAVENLNLQAMLYFSDHGCVPNERRKSYFTGFGPLRIPMSIHLTDSYIALHKERCEAMRENREKYFTNDLIYEFVCGMLDVESNHFAPEGSLAHKEYKYTREMLLTNSGTVPLTDEDKE